MARSEKLDLTEEPGADQACDVPRLVIGLLVHERHHETQPPLVQGHEHGMRKCAL